MNIKKFIAAAILYNPNDKTVLLQHRATDDSFDANRWGLFGGHSEHNEEIQEALLRELKEEIGIDFTGEKIVPLHDYPSPALPAVHRYVFVIESVLKKTEMQLGEGQGFDWVPIEKVFDYDLTATARRDLKAFLDHVGN